jgi:hypothetical protein
LQQPGLLLEREVAGDSLRKVQLLEPRDGFKIAEPLGIAERGRDVDDVVVHRLLAVANLQSALPEALEERFRDLLQWDIAGEAEEMPERGVYALGPLLRMRGLVVAEGLGLECPESGGRDFATCPLRGRAALE